MEQKNFLTRKEAAAYLNLAVSTIDLLMARKQLPRIKVGRKVLFKKQDLDEFMERHYQGRGN